jgi:hypothetical protein
MHLYGKLREIYSKTRKGGVIATFWKQRGEKCCGVLRKYCIVSEES